ncbi:hypothetical protein BegalDRAFT_1313 [Beggiatoa alba B18LD]|uniref:Nudix hydrolase domain-containing protein n=1 Tax=Beggiatoa alba B18LD TaxID=395493 RepID=I3CF16_9GAMM|nr:hypothetical protein [Beggiatoa alba]EIJ42209.1 hypothetical protein BegalDRAFT_1313 [Beggiatoa alba B18LD]
MSNLLPLTVLLKYLPIHVKEGHHRTIVTRDYLINVLQQEAFLSVGESMLLIDVVERLFCSVAVLDKEILHEQAWCFVSFPAQSFAIGLLQVLADKQQNLLDPFFWEVSFSPHENIVSEQHELLFWLETQRLQHHQSKLAKPTNYVANSVTFIKLDDQFLLHRREGNLVKDQHGEFVLIGGCTNLADLEHLELSLPEKLALLKEPHHLPYSVVEKTLIREIKEETTLELDKDYSLFFIEKIEPYNHLSGSGVNYAYTCYYFSLFRIQLTEQGFFRLLQAEQDKPQIFSWFTLEELQASRTSDGKTAYIDVLHAHFSSNFKKVMGEIPNSFNNQYNVLKESDSVTLPLHQARFLRVGATGKEKTLNIPLTTRQCQLLWLLGAHARQFRIIACHASFQLFPYGWVQGVHLSFIEEMQIVATLLREHHLDLLEFVEGHYYRLNLDPQLIFFDEANFQAFLSKSAQEPYQISIVNQSVLTPWATIEENSLMEKLTPHLGVSLQELMTGKNSYCSAEEKEKLDKFVDLARKKINCKAIGLRLFLRTEENRCRLSCNISAKINGKKLHLAVID